jgi:hypothetical protein
MKKVYRDAYNREVAKLVELHSVDALKPETAKAIKEYVANFKQESDPRGMSLTYLLAEDLGLTYVEGLASVMDMQTHAFLKADNRYIDPDIELHEDAPKFHTYYAMVEGTIDDLKSRFNFNSQTHMIEQFLNYERDMDENMWSQMQREIVGNIREK